MPEIVKLVEENAKVGEGPIWDQDTQTVSRQSIPDTLAISLSDSISYK